MPITRMPLPALALLLAGCGPAGAVRPPDAAVLPGTMVEQLLMQCSRAAPPAGEATWQPGAADIAALEAALPAALTAQREPGQPDWSRAPQGWLRQYVGIVRGGRRYIYGSFYPRSIADPAEGRPDQWLAEPHMICDGGPAFFGVEYDVEAGRFTHMSFNGVA